MTDTATSGLRVSDVERDAVAHELREHFAVGRLTIDELHERLDRLYAARTRADLDAVTVDLPRPTAEPDTGRRRQGRRFDRWAKYLRVNAICWSIWGVGVATAPGHHVQGMWPLWVTLPWGAALLSRHQRHC